MSLTPIVKLLPGLLVCTVLVGPAQSQMTPKDIIDRSVRAHGGDRLTNWDTMTIKGTVDMLDGITFRAAYRLFAKAPGKLRVEKDMTVVQGGRIFYDYFLNSGMVWNRRNLVPSSGNLDEMNRWMNQCYGIAYYANKSGYQSPTDFIPPSRTTIYWRDFETRGPCGENPRSRRHGIFEPKDVPSDKEIQS